MRLYTFTHFMLSSIQQGIQPSHAQSNLFLKYQDKKTKEHKALFEWIQAPTMICLNGGNSAGLKELYDQLENLGTFLRLPFSQFFEDQQSLEGIRTSVSIVVPERIYTAAAVMRDKSPNADWSAMAQDLHQTEVDLANLLNRYSLAR